MKTDRRAAGYSVAVRLLALGAVLAWLAGCYAPSALDQDYGHAVRNNIAQQIVNPRAGLEASPTAGLSPKAAVNSMERYDKSFKGEEKKQLEMKAITSF